MNESMNQRVVLCVEEICFVLHSFVVFCIWYHSSHMDDEKEAITTTNDQRRRFRYYARRGNASYLGPARTDDKS
eukprot:scaffold1749_cov181-Amphora_coffeaeformis.AAC.1